MYWTPDCANTVARWYSQDHDWKTPKKPDKKCQDDDHLWMKGDDECSAEWSRYESECMNMHDYMWTNGCEAASMLGLFKRS